MATRKKTTSFKLSKQIEQKMLETLVFAGYGLRGKSKWIVDSLMHFVSQPVEFCIDTIGIADELGELERTVSFRPTEELDIKINELIVKIRLKHPMIEGLKSKIIRAAICQGILREELIK